MVIENTERQLFSKAEVATMLRVSTSTVDRWTEAGLLPALKVGPKTVRFSKSTIEEFLRRSKI